MSAFDSETWFSIRTRILDEQEKDTYMDPFIASFRHLIAVGVMGHCVHGKMSLGVKNRISCKKAF